MILLDKTAPSSAPPLYVTYLSDVESRIVNTTIHALCPPGQVTRIIIPFNGKFGRFVWHCHMLEHEDNNMMRPYVLRA